MPKEQQTLSLEQAIDFAMQHHNAGRLSEAEHIYRQILNAHPNHFDSLHLLGVIAHQTGKIDTAIDLIRKAISIRPHFAKAHCNLGISLMELGKLDEAIASYREALDLKADFVEAHNNLGIALQRLGKLEEALACYRKAIDFKTDYAEAYNNTGVVLQDLGRSREAISNYQRAITLKPDYAEAHDNVGIALRDLGELKKAEASFRTAATIKPDYAAAHNNLGATLQDLGELDDAVSSYRRALELQPEYSDAHSNLGNALNILGHFDESKAEFDQGFRLRHGGAWWNAATYVDGNSANAIPATKEIPTSAFKIRDTIDQLEYLISKGCIDPSFGRLIDRYRTVLAEIQLMEKPEAVTKLTPGQLEHLGPSHNRVIHYVNAPRIDASTTNEALDFEQIEDRYFSSPVSVTTLDDFLTPEALRGVRDFCLESTIFFTHTGNRFMSSNRINGFNCDLLCQIAEDVKEHFPRILGNHHLSNMWVYRYNNQTEGVAAHTDEGAVTFNFWITPNDANLSPDRGGLIVYAKEQPLDWDWLHYNNKKYTPAVRREVSDFLADADTVTIPYRENRAALFHSNLFHKSDDIHFRDSFSSRRMNITLLFGKRQG